jgi:hypothetical protein
MMLIDENATSHRYVEPKQEYIFRAMLIHGIFIPVHQSPEIVTGCK